MQMNHTELGDEEGDRQEPPRQVRRGPRLLVARRPEEEQEAAGGDQDVERPDCSWAGQLAPPRWVGFRVFRFAVCLQRQWTGSLLSPALAGDPALPRSAPQPIYLIGGGLPPL